MPDEHRALVGLFEMLLLGAICVAIAARVAGFVPFNAFVISLLVFVSILAIRVWRR